MRQICIIGTITFNSAAFEGTHAAINCWNISPRDQEYALYCNYAFGKKHKTYLFDWHFLDTSAI